MSAPRGLGELLIEEGLIDAPALHAAERYAGRQGCALVSALLEEGRVGEDELVGTLERRLGLPRADLGHVDLDAVRELPLETVERFAVLPLAVERQSGRRVLRLAMADPLDRSAIEDIEFATGCRVDAQLAPPSEVARAIQRYYRGLATKLIRPLSGGSAPAPVAEIDDGGSAPTGAAAAGPKTQPRHRLENEASPELKLRALLRVLYARGVLSEDEYQAELKALLEGED
ncbi:MAG TPA: hypothetical protein VKN99_20945 [Polyangia bacterium]|nr:hypothetical protein [Polyangia bacterium]